MVNQDNAAYFGFTGPARLDKAIHTLEGLLKGVAADGTVCKDELAAVGQWVADHAEFAHRHPFNEIIPLLRAALSDGVFDSEELADALWLCDKLRADGAYYDMVSSDMQRLHGVLGGIISDGKVTMDELTALSKWMQDHEHLKRCWPYDEIESLLVGVREDGKIDDKEHALLLTFLGEFTGIGGNRAVDFPLNEVGVPITGLCAVCPEIIFPDRVFCFTGSSPRASRRELSDIIDNLGGSFTNRVTREVAYLVIGSDGNPCWAYACYGRKVEQAISLRKEGRKILLVHEHDFWDAADTSR